ncbi:MAG TPA: hypothetical protein VMC43_02790 [Candidatus Paceibacterota bacterium]|nr:hypothetical protein [Candidatus Paceibacterota bacterium]
MDTLIHADVFFFVTAIAVVIVGFVLAIAGVYFILILRDVRYIARRAREGSDQLTQDVNDLRATLRAEGAQLKMLIDGLTRMFGGEKKRSRRK